MTCEHCPYKKKKGCPFWVDKSAGLLETNQQTGEQRLMEGCITDVFIRCMTFVVQAVNGAQTAVESTRNQIHEDMQQLNLGLTFDPSKLLIANGEDDAVSKE